MQTTTTKVKVGRSMMGVAVRIREHEARRVQACVCAQRREGKESPMDGAAGKTVHGRARVPEKYVYIQYHYSSSSPSSRTLCSGAPWT